jgi:hypothetical protein
MGLFLTMAGVARADTAEIRSTLAAFASERGKRFEPTGASADRDNAVVVHRGPGGHTLLFAWLGFQESAEIADYLSAKLAVPVFLFHIHDGDLWMYMLFDKGEVIDRFCPIPNYWQDDIPDDEFRKWRGDAATIATHWPDIQPGKIANYLVRWNLDDRSPPKAYPDDEYAPGWDYQLLDFMRRLGLEYPIGGPAEIIKGVRFPPTRSETSRFIGETYTFEDLERQD